MPPFHPWEGAVAGRVGGAPLKANRPHDVAAAYAKAHIRCFEAAEAAALMPIQLVGMRILDRLRHPRRGRRGPDH